VERVRTSPADYQRTISQLSALLNIRVKPSNFPTFLLLNFPQLEEVTTRISELTAGCKTRPWISIFTVTQQRKLAVRLNFIFSPNFCSSHLSFSSRHRITSQPKTVSLLHLCWKREGGNFLFLFAVYLKMELKSPRTSPSRGLLNPCALQWGGGVSGRGSCFAALQ
jgi:hypothetical protein